MVFVVVVVQTKCRHCSIEHLILEFINLLEDELSKQLQEHSKGFFFPANSITSVASGYVKVCFIYKYPEMLAALHSALFKILIQTF